eukprot:TRINITY_DN2062_c0_g1_i1.p1 TRINITY_DN2062_c0_g1~~TRINITY_DN2062_c0_g1_i1.p1  ORF type:complete len:696 (-),score=120.92 TRINITY_DN2062_c0_g1_i1:142-2193(-)
MACRQDENYFPLADGEKGTPFLASSSASAKKSLCSTVKSYLPILEWFPQYPWKENSAADLAGGATLGCILVAQSLAHADLCKVNLINGPYSCLLPPLVYSFFGTCTHSSVGTGGLISLLTGIQLAKYGDLEERTRAGAIFTMLVGSMIALMGILRLAFLVRFLSRPALSGFITASALLIIFSQLKPMLGLPSSVAGGIVEVVLFHSRNLEMANVPTVVLSACAMGFLRYAKQLKTIHASLRYLGDFKELFALGASAVFCRWASESLKISVVGDVPSGLPGLEWPLRSASVTLMAKEMVPGALLVALVTFLSSFAGAKKFALKAGYQIVATNELLALGFANMAGAFCGAVPTQIGLSRMGIAYSAGVKSQLGANIYVAVIVALVVQAFSSYLYFVPRCVLNCIIVNGASHLMEWDQMSWLWSLSFQHKEHGVVRMHALDFVIWWIACLCTLFLGAFEGIIFAVAASLVLLIYQVADPQIVTLGWVEDRKRWLSLKVFENARPREGIIVFRIEGPLFYANIEAVQDWLEEVEAAAVEQDGPLKAIILSAAAMPLVDTTAVQALQSLVQAYDSRNIAFLVANATGQPAQIFQDVLGDKLPADLLQSSATVQECVDYLNEQQKAKMKRRTMIGAEAPCQFSESARNPAERDAEPIPLMRSFKYPSRKNLGAEDKKHLRSVVRRVTYA